MAQQFANTRTIDVIAAASQRAGDEVVIAGEVAEIHFPSGASLSLLASKMLVQILDLAGAAVVRDQDHRAAIAALNWSHRDLNSIEDTIRELQRTIVQITVQTSRGERRKSGQILTDIERDVDAATGELVWRFSRTFREIVKNSTHWASISARAVMEMECKYSPWLYQLCALHAGRRQVTRDWPLAVLRERLGASAPSMQRWQDFKRYALEPAVAEVNHLTGIAVTWAPVKIGREVVAVRLACSRKQPPEIAAAAAEINRPRVGRRARRAGTVEQIASEQGARRRAIAEELAALPPFPPRSDD